MSPGARSRKHAPRRKVRAGALICLLFLWITPGRALEVEAIVRQAAAALRTDWAASLDYSWRETDESRQKDKTTRKTYRVLMIAGSDYYLPLAENGEPISLQQSRTELEKLKAEVSRRNNEDSPSRRKRLDAFRRQRDENGAMLVEMPDAFTFALAGEGSIRGRDAWILAATPIRRSGATSRAAKVLMGVRGTVWIDKESFHTIRAECDVVTPVPIFGILARVMPGTHIEFEMTPLNDSVWLLRSRAMTLTVIKFFWFRSTQITSALFSDYGANEAMLEELLSGTGLP